MARHADAAPAKPFPPSSRCARHADNGALRFTVLDSPRAPREAVRRSIFTCIPMASGGFGESSDYPRTIRSESEKSPNAPMRRLPLPPLPPPPLFVSPTSLRSCVCVGFRSLQPYLLSYCSRDSNNASATGGKRKLKAITLEQKTSMIKAVASGAKEGKVHSVVRWQETLTCGRVRCPPS